MLILKAWHLGKAFFFDKAYRRTANFLLVTSIGFQFAMVYMSVIMNQWSSNFYNSLQELDKIAFYNSIKTFVWVLPLFVFVVAAKYVCQARLALSWRKFMSLQYCDKWIKHNAFFGAHLLNHKNDNPDQRISEDLSSFTILTINLFFGLLDSILTLISFLAILWSLSGILKFSIFETEFTIYGYLVWAAIICSIIFTAITYRVGRRLPGIDYLQEQKEANFRFAMMRVRENSESIALYKGQKYEMTLFQKALDEVVQNNLNIININRNLSISSSIVANLINITPIIIATPKLFAKEIMVGGLMQIRGAFGHVQEAFSFLATSFQTIAQYRAVIDRLTGLNDIIEQWDTVIAENNIQLIEQNGDELQLKDLIIASPNQHVLFKKLNYNFAPGNAYLISGKNGAGKSTLLKAIAGIWIFGKGKIILPKDKSIFFIPQNSYMNIGTLAQIITYPNDEMIDLEIIKKLMREIKLDHMIDRLDQEENWSISLSGGEQQKIAILRAIIHKPDILIMDESTSALTENDEVIAYQLLKQHLINAIIISVGHRASIKQFHNQELNLSAQ